MKNKINLVTLVLVTTFSNIFGTWQPIYPGMPVEEFAPHAQKFVNDNKVSLDWIKYNFEQMKEAVNNARSREEQENIKQNLIKLQCINRAFIKKQDEKNKVHQSSILEQDNYYELNYINRKISAIIYGNNFEERMRQIDTEYEEEKEKRIADREKDIKLKQELDETRQKLYQVGATARRNAEESQWTVGILSRMFPQLTNGPSDSQERPSDIPITYTTNITTASSTSSTSPRQPQQPQSTDQQPSSSWW